MAQDALKKAESRMQKSIEALERDLAAIRTGRANPSLVEHVMVDYYGTPTPLNQLATINVADGRSLVIQPWDKGAMGSIEKGILKSDLGLNPANDGNVIRLPIPPLTEERRKELVRLVRKRIEDGKVSIRNIRRDAVEELRALEKDKKISQDDQHRSQDQVQKATDNFIQQADKLGGLKEAELMEV